MLSPALYLSVADFVGCVGFPLESPGCWSFCAFRTWKISVYFQTGCLSGDSSNEIEKAEQHVSKNDIVDVSK